MPYVQVPKDLAKIKTKVAFNLTVNLLFDSGSNSSSDLFPYK